MGSTSSDHLISKHLKPTVGGLVWVRRKNGTWWPGQIMDANAFPDDSLPSPRSEVPIQLLARDDASVEWYNLEKSKCVKSFRCGDYNTCIEKAKVLVSTSSRKTAKHTKRENAILCALELESALLSQKHENNCSRPDNSDSESDGKYSNNTSLARELPPGCLDLMPEKITSLEENSNCAPEFSDFATTYEEENKCDDLERQPSETKTRRNLHDSEDDGSEGVKRMRGLNDLGKGSDKTVIGGLTDSGPQDVVLLKDLCETNDTMNKVQASGSRGYPLPQSFKKKRSKVVFHEYLKRRNRRRMLTKVLQCNKWVTIPVMYDDFPNPCKSRSSQGIGSIQRSLGNDSTSNGILKSTIGHTGKCGSTLVKLECGESLFPPEPDFDCDDLFDVPVMGKEEFSNGALPYIVPCASSKPQVNSLGECLSQNGHVEISNGGCANFASTHGAQFSLNMDKGASSSEWQSKGRRNSRHLMKNGELDAKRSIDNIRMELDDLEEPSPSYGGQANHSPPSVEHVLSDGRVCSSRSVAFHQCGMAMLPRYEIPDSVLYNVEIEVKASYRPHHVPYISLMSKLNGKAIIGHPIAVEVLEDGGCDCYLDSLDLDQSSESVQLDEEECGNEEEVGVLEGGEFLQGRREYSSPKKRVKAWHISSSSAQLSKSSPLSKSSKKPNGSSGMKTRTLSSLTGSFRGKKGGKNMKKNHHREGWKPIQNLKSPAVTCIPLKLVFSRINEALSGPASNGAMHIS